MSHLNRRPGGAPLDGRKSQIITTAVDEEIVNGLRKLTRRKRKDLLEAALQAGLLMLLEETVAKVQRYPRPPKTTSTVLLRGFGGLN